VADLWNFCEVGIWGAAACWLAGLKAGTSPSARR
jgi:hypothetical protein